MPDSMVAHQQPHMRPICMICIVNTDSFIPAHSQSYSQSEDLRSLRTRPVYTTDLLRQRARFPCGPMGMRSSVHHEAPIQAQHRRRTRSRDVRAWRRPRREELNQAGVTTQRRGGPKTSAQWPGAAQGFISKVRPAQLSVHISGYAVEKAYGDLHLPSPEEQGSLVVKFRPKCQARHNL